MICFSSDPCLVMNELPVTCFGIWVSNTQVLWQIGNFLSLYAYRIRNLAMEVFKCFHGMNPMYLNNLFCKQERKYDLRDKTLLEQPKFSTKTYGYRSFKYYGSKLWNAHPFEIKKTENYDEFKLRLTTWCHSSDLDKLDIF